MLLVSRVKSLGVCAMSREKRVWPPHPERDQERAEEYIPIQQWTAFGKEEGRVKTASS